MKAGPGVVTPSVPISAMLQPSGRIAEAWNAHWRIGVPALSDVIFGALPVRLMRRKLGRYTDHAALRQRLVSDLAAVA
jgi:hypothetical protein